MDQLSYIESRIRFYAVQVDIKRLRLITNSDQPPTPAYEKAFRCMCLALKSMTATMDVRGIKDSEIFVKWDRVQQYINSD